MMTIKVSPEDTQKAIVEYLQKNDILPKGNYKANVFIELEKKLFRKPKIDVYVELKQN